jgi:hypothetical protein
LYPGRASFAAEARFALAARLIPCFIPHLPATRDDTIAMRMGIELWGEFASFSDWAGISLDDR